MKIVINLILTFTFLLLTFDFAHSATGCNYPTTLDSWADKASGDFLTTGDINSRSCAIEQLESRLNQILNGRAGGQTITGGTAALQNLNLRSTANATKGFIVLGSNSAFDEGNNYLGLGTTAPSRAITVVRNDSNTMLLQTTAAGIGPRVELLHTGSFNDVGAISFLAYDASSIARTTGLIQGWYLDGTTTSQDSEMRFCVMNNVNAGNCNTVGTLSSLGVWTDASTQEIKEYEGDLKGSAIGNLKKLSTLGVYRGKNIPPGKIKNAERHYSPTAEEFFTVFELGKAGSGGIAPKDAAWIAAKAVLELEARVFALETKVK